MGAIAGAPWHLEEAILAPAKALTLIVALLLEALQLLTHSLQLLRVPLLVAPALAQLRLQLCCLPLVTLCGAAQLLLHLLQLGLRASQHIRAVAVLLKPAHNLAGALYTFKIY